MWHQSLCWSMCNLSYTQFVCCFKQLPERATSHCERQNWLCSGLGPEVGREDKCSTGSNNIVNLMLHWRSSSDSSGGASKGLRVPFIIFVLWLRKDFIHPPPALFLSPTTFAYKNAKMKSQRGKSIHKGSAVVSVLPPPLFLYFSFAIFKKNATWKTHTIFALEFQPRGQKIFHTIRAESSCVCVCVSVCRGREEERWQGAVFICRWCWLYLLIVQQTNSK